MTTSIDVAGPIDCHAHWVPTSAARAAERGEVWYGTQMDLDPRGNPCGTTGERSFALGSPRHVDPWPRRLEIMDELGVEVQVISLVPPMVRHHLPADIGVDAARAVNEEIAEVVHTYPGRVVGLATLPMKDPDAACAELERAMGELELAGALMVTHVDGVDLDDERLAEVWQVAELLKASVFLHPDDIRWAGPPPPYFLRNLVGNPFETTHAVARLLLSGRLFETSHVRLLLAHGGGYLQAGLARLRHGLRVRPENADATWDGTFPANVWVDGVIHQAERLAEIARDIGPERIVIGSDYPADMGIEDPVGHVRRVAELLGTPADDLLYRNALSWLGKESPAEHVTTADSSIGRQPRNRHVE